MSLRPRFCPYCGHPLESRVDVDNATGRRSWSYGCPTSGHYRTGGHASADAALQATIRRFA